MNDKRIKAALDIKLSHISFSQANFNAVRVGMKKEMVMKKKSVYVFACATVLLLALGVAYAFSTFGDYAKTLPEKEHTQGIFRNWAMVDKVELVRQLVNSGDLEANEQTELLLNGTLDHTESSVLAENIMKDWMNRPLSLIGFKSIMENVWGDFEEWTLEQKAWYTESYAEADLLGADHIRYVLPGPDAFPEEDARREAQRTLEIVNCIPRGSLDAYRVITEFVISPEIIRAGDDLRSAVYSDEGVDPVWLFAWIPPMGMENPPISTTHIRVNSVTGIVDIENTSAFVQFERMAQRLPENPNNRTEKQGHEYVPFFEWPLEAKAAWSKAYRSIILDKDNADMVQVPTAAFAKHQYGTPDAASIAEEAAFDKALEAIRNQFEVSDDILGRYTTVYTYYDIGDTTKPKWRFHFQARGWDAVALQETYLKASIPCYRVEIDAHTGAMITVESYCPESISGIEALLKWL